jgi:hypothetical protein
MNATETAALEQAREQFKPNSRAMPGNLRLEVKGGHATVFDQDGQVIPELCDIELGWTDTSTGPYVDPAKRAEFLAELVKRWNGYPHFRGITIDISWALETHGRLGKPLGWVKRIAHMLRVY